MSTVLLDLGTDMRLGGWVEGDAEDHESGAASKRISTRLMAVIYRPRQVEARFGQVGIGPGLPNLTSNVLAL